MSVLAQENMALPHVYFTSNGGTDEGGAIFFLGCDALADFFDEVVEFEGFLV
jgi:predicted outer membrane repeat protein